jgi:hypothetical protein
MPPCDMVLLLKVFLDKQVIVKSRNRDTAWLLMLEKEWKKIKKEYVKYLNMKNFDQNFKQIRKLIVK